MASIFTSAWARLEAWGHRKRWARDHVRKMREADGIVVSHTKSGSTWLRVMISHLYHLRYGVPENEILNFDNLHRLNPAIPKLHFARDTATPFFSVFDTLVPAPAEQKILFLLRDPRDVAVSFYFHVLHRAGRRELDRKRISRDAVSAMTLYEFVTDEHLGVPRVIGYMNRWWEERSRFSATCLIKYEEMKRDPQAALQKAISFLDREFDETLLQQAVQFASFENLARKEATGFFNSRRMQPGDVSDPNTFKVRRGQVGGYRDYFDAKELEAIDALLRDALPAEIEYCSK